jgi:hypothetical protein
MHPRQHRQRTALFELIGFPKKGAAMVPSARWVTRLVKGQRRLSRRRLRQLVGSRQRLAFEPLEQRHLLAIIAWDGGGDGTNWHDAANWVGDLVPGISDNAVIPAAFSAVNVRVGAAERSVLRIDSSASIVLEGAK